jgi:hypothetical protein
MSNLQINTRYKAIGITAASIEVSINIPAASGSLLELELSA